MAKKDFYEILGVSKNATQDEIKAAYRKMALKYHPDRNPDNKEAEDKFKEAAEANETLSNPQKRKQYDTFGHNGPMGGGSGYQSQDMGDIFSHFEDMFGDIFGSGGGGSRKKAKKNSPTPKKGHDLAKELVLTLKEAFEGTTKDVKIYHFATCQTCKGKGMPAGASAKECKECQGSGEIGYRHGMFMYSQACPGCHGEGYIIADACKTCKGQSRVQQYDTVTLNIPKGIYDGAELRVADRGDAGVFGGKSGNLFLNIRVMPDPNFKRIGDDLECSVSVTYPQLVFGCQIEVENIDGSKESLKIPKGWQSGQSIIIKEKGFVQIKSKGRGNLIVIPKCDVPKKLSKEAEETLRKYSELIGTQTDSSDGFIKSFFKKFLG